MDPNKPMSNPQQKSFRLKAEQIDPSLAPGRGSCVASDMITVGGCKVGFTYRQEPQNDLDSGWCFMAGPEPKEFMDDPANFEIYDVNTIANYDPDIIPLLDAPIGSVFKRPGGAGAFVEVHDFDPE
jgi:hypothetical protein